MTKLIVTIFGVLCTMISFGQNTFELFYGGPFLDRGYNILITDEGDYIASGESTVYHYQTALDSVRIYLIKINNTGQTQWEHKIEIAPYAVGRSSCMTYDGGTVTTGEYRKEIITNNYAHLYILKTDDSGQIEWTQLLELFGPEENIYPINIVPTVDSGFLISGQVNVAGSSDEHLVMIKTNSIGDTMWTKIYGGDFFEMGGYAEQTSDNGFILGGSKYYYGEQNSDFYLIKTNETGDTTWTRTYGENHYEWLNEVHQLEDGGYICVGTALNSPQHTVYLVRTNENGDSLWSRKYFEEDNNVYGRSCHQTLDQGFIITGWRNSPPYFVLMKVDGNGDVLWKQVQEDKSFMGLSVKQAPDEGYIITGSMEPPSGGKDLVIMKTNESGQVKLNEYTADESSVSLKIHPNPFTDEVNLEIESEQDGPANIRIYNSNGLMINEFDLYIHGNAHKFNWAGTSLAPGLYYIRM